MKIQRVIGGAATLSVVLLGGLSVAAWSQDTAGEKSQKLQAEAEQTEELSFRVGKYFFHARSEENGLYRDVMVHDQRQDAKTSKPTSIVVFAKYARKDTSKPNQWVLGSGTASTYDGRGVKSEMTFKRLLVKTN